MEVCPVEERNALLKKPILNVKDLSILIGCPENTAYSRLEEIRQWLKEQGRPTFNARRKLLRTVDYIDFAGLPRELML